MMDLQAEKIALIKMVLETENESVIQKLKQMLVDDANESQYEMMDSHKTELDRRLTRMNSGKTKFYSWEEVEQKLKLVS